MDFMEMKGSTVIFCRANAALVGNRQRHTLGWLPSLSVVMVSFMSQLGHGYPDIWTNIILWGCFGVRLTFKSVGSVKQIALPSAGGPHIISWRSDSNKRADLPANKREFLLPDCFWTKTWALPGSWARQSLDWNHTIGSHGCPACQPTL